jgi:tRNA-splicing ligase RtcB (3'-phosphate/5'-hydroxy nucleic acid ligase)
MVEHAADFEWRGEGEEAEIALYASDGVVAEAFFERVLPAARLPGVLSPVCAAASGLSRGFGWVAASETHAAPDLVSAPEQGLLLVADAPVESVGAPLAEVPRLIGRRLSEVALPDISKTEARRLVETGALWAVEEGLIEEDDLPLFAADASDADSLGRRALVAGARDWTRPGLVRALRVAESLNSEGAESLGLESGALALVVSAGAEDLGRLALASHRERISARTTAGDFGSPADLPAAPVDTGEARDLLVATAAAANYAAGRAALLVYALRRALGEVGTLGLRAAWTVGGFEERDRWVLHRSNLAAAGAGAALTVERTVAAGTGGMLGSAPLFEVPEEDGRWAWEEAGLLERWAILEPLGGWLGEVGAGRWTS